MAKMKKLEDLFHDTLKDVYFAEKKILASLPKMAKAAQHAGLKAAETPRRDRRSIDRLEQVFAEIDKKPQSKTCDASWASQRKARRLWTSKGMPAHDAGCSPQRRPLNTTK
jgi:ferritin-like metal-binding protein YciE